MLTIALATALAQTPAPPVDAHTPVQTVAPVEAAPVAPTVFAMEENIEATAPSGDVFSMAQKVVLDGGVSDNAFTMAERLEVQSPVDGDLFVMAKEVVVNAPVRGDIYGLAAEVTITPKGSVGGHVRLGAGELVVNGPIGGDLDGEVGKLELDGPIRGSVAMKVGSVKVGQNAFIGGDLDYSSKRAHPALEAVSAGHVTFDEEVVEIAVAEEPEAESSWMSAAVWWGGWTFWGVFTDFLAGCLLFFVGGRAAADVGREIAARPGPSLGRGFILSVLIPALSVLALVLIIPFPLGLAGLAAFSLLLYVAQIFAAQAVGESVLKRIRPDAVGSPYISLAVGVLPLGILLSIPWLGTLGWLVVTMVGIGAISSVIQAHR